MALSTISGNTIGLYVTSAETGAVSRLVGLSTSCSLSYSNNVIETAAKNGIATISTLHSVAGTGSFTMSIDGLVDITTAEDNAGTTASDEHGFNNLMDMAITGTAVEVVFKSDTGTTYTGSAFIDSLEATAGVDSFASFTCSLKGTGGLTVA
jgi:hypothetical protein